MSDLLIWVPSQPTPIKVMMSIITLALFVGAQVVIWSSPAANKEVEKAPTTAPSSSPHERNVYIPSANVEGHNLGVVAGVYNAAPETGQAQEELAQEQLAEVRRRRIEEQAAQRQRELADAQARVRQRVNQLTQEYILSHDGLSPALLAGLETPPDEWMNERLQQLDEPYTFRGLGGGRYDTVPKR